MTTRESLLKRLAELTNLMDGSEKPLAGPLREVKYPEMRKKYSKHARKMMGGFYDKMRVLSLALSTEERRKAIFMWLMDHVLDEIKCFAVANNILRGNPKTVEAGKIMLSQTKKPLAEAVTEFLMGYHESCVEAFSHTNDAVRLSVMNAEQSFLDEILDVSPICDRFGLGDDEPPPSQKKQKTHHPESHKGIPRNTCATHQLFPSYNSKNVIEIFQASPTTDGKKSRYVFEFRFPPTFRKNSLAELVAMHKPTPQSQPKQIGFDQGFDRLALSTASQGSMTLYTVLGKYAPFTTATISNRGTSAFVVGYDGSAGKSAQLFVDPNCFCSISQLSFEFRMLDGDLGALESHKNVERVYKMLKKVPFGDVVFDSAKKEEDDCSIQHCSVSNKCSLGGEVIQFPCRLSLECKHTRYFCFSSIVLHWHSRRKRSKDCPDCGKEYDINTVMAIDFSQCGMQPSKEEECLYDVLPSGKLTIHKDTSKEGRICVELD